MSKNPNTQSEKEMISIPIIEYRFLKSQNAKLIAQNKALQKQLYGQSRGIAGVFASMGKSVLDKYTGEKDVQ